MMKLVWLFLISCYLSIDGSLAQVSSNLFTLERRISQSGDDAIENLSNNQVISTSVEIELGHLESSNGEFSKTIAGFRFRNINITTNSVVTKANLEFISDDINSSPLDLRIKAELDLFPSEFGKINSTKLSDRMRTVKSSAWANVASVTEVGQILKSFNLRATIQELIEIPGWESGKDVLFLVYADDNYSGNGQRLITSYEKDPTNAAKLSIQFYPYFSPESEGSGGSQDGSGTTTTSTPLIVLILVGFGSVAAVSSFILLAFKTRKEQQEKIQLKNLEEILDNNDSYDNLLEFCKGKYAEENIKFIKAVHIFEKQVYQDLGDRRTTNQTQQAARKIVNAFILEGSAQEINIDAKTRAKLTSLSVFGINAFVDAKTEIMRLIGANFLKEFKKEMQQNLLSPIIAP